MTILERRSGGFIGDFLARSLKSEEPTKYVRLRLGTENSYTTTDFFSRGDSQTDIVEVARSLIGNYCEGGKNGVLQDSWESLVYGLKDPTLKIGGTQGLELRVGTLDMASVAELVDGVKLPEPIYNADKRRILSRDEVLLMFRIHTADLLINSARYSEPSEMRQAPSKQEFSDALNQAGAVYDHYMSFSVGSLMVTKDFIFPYIIGRKQSPNLIQPSEGRGGQTWKGAVIPTGDVNVHFTGVETGCASHMMKNPVFRGDYSKFAMDILQDTFVVPKEDEKDYVRNVVESMGDFSSVWIQNPPSEIIKEYKMTPNSGYSWHPTKDELIRSSNIHLGIKE